MYSLSLFLLRTVHPNKFSNFSFSLFICGDGVAFTLFNNSLWNFRQRFKSSVLSLNFRYFFLFISIMMKISNISHDLMFSCVIVPCWKFVWTNVFPIFCRSARVSISAFFLSILHYRKDITSIRIHFIHFLFHLSRIFFCRVSNFIWIEPCQFSYEQNKMLTFNKKLKFEFR